MGERRTLYERAVQLRGHWYIHIKGGRLIGFWDAMREAERGETTVHRGVSRAFKLAKAKGDDYELERLEWFIEKVEDYVRSVKGAIAEQRSYRTEEERIAALRNTAGRTPEEAAAFTAKADELEQRLVARG